MHAAEAGRAPLNPGPPGDQRPRIDWTGATRAPRPSRRRTVDVVVTALEERLVVWRNVSPGENHWLSVRTVGTRSNRDGIGTKLRLKAASGVQHSHVNTAVGYSSASDLRVHFGLGKDAVVEELRLEWPSGTVDVLRDVKADQLLTVREGETGGGRSGRGGASVR